MEYLATTAFDNVFQEIGAVLLIAVVVGALAARLRQPLIVAFIAVGIALGPVGFGLIQESDELELLAEIGIALLLFLVGLKLDLHLIRSVGPVALVAGLGQVAFTSLVGFGIALGLGFAPLPALYIAVALTFSSTIIIVKLLSDKHEVEETHGKIALGILIVQDIVVVVVMIGLSALGGADEAAGGIGVELALTGVRAVLFVAVIGLLMRYVLPALLERLAEERELLILFAIAWAIALAASGEILGFSQEVGAFVGGVSLASTGYREAIGGRLLSVRDFLLLFFFVNLGVGLDFADAGEQIVPAVVLSLFVLIGNPLIVMTIMGVMGYRARTGFLTGLTVAQISEFSLIFAALGLAVGHITDTHVGLITIVGVITIGLSTYLILYSKPLWKRFGHLLGVFERSSLRERSLSDADAAPHAEIIILGLGRFGSRLAEHLRLRGRRVLAVDDDPQVVRLAKEAGHLALYGDAGDPELLEHLPVDHARWIVVTVPELDATLTTLQAIHEAGYRCGVMVTARTEEDLEVLEQTDAHFVAFPWQDAAEDAADRLDLMQPGNGDRRNVRQRSGE